VWHVAFALALGIVLAVGPTASAYEVVDLQGAGSVSGRVRFGGERPAEAFLPVYKNADVCGERVPDGSLRVSEGGGLAGVVVEILGVAGGKPLPTGVAGLDNVRCAFVPRVQALVVGQSLELRNSDPVLHDAHARLGARTIFNLGLPSWRRVTHVLSEPGLYAIDCNVLHTWMRAWVFVSEHPYVAVTDHDGRFSLRDVPAGRYRLRLWHERLGEKRVGVAVEPHRESEIAVSFGGRGGEKRSPDRTGGVTPRSPDRTVGVISPIPARMRGMPPRGPAPGDGGLSPGP